MNFSPLAISQGQRTYDGVLASDPATSFLDAGKLTFRDETHQQWRWPSIDLHATFRMVDPYKNDLPKAG